MYQDFYIAAACLVVAIELGGLYVVTQTLQQELGPRQGVLLLIFAVRSFDMFSVSVPMSACPASHLPRSLHTAIGRPSHPAAFPERVTHVQLAWGAVDDHCATTAHVHLSRLAACLA